MAHYGKSQATRSNDWTTPPEAWGDLVQYIPDGAIIWESAYCDGASGGRIAALQHKKRVARAQHKPRQTLRPATAISDDRGEVLQRHIYKK